MPTIELVYESSCPNVQRTRMRLAEAMRAAGLAPSWTEWEIGDPAAPAHARAYGSPTILVEGRDVAGQAPGEESRSCRLYSLDGADRGVPPLDLIVAALSAQGGAPAARGTARLNPAILPSAGLVLLPKLTCAACWPAYAALLSSLGVGFFDYTPYLLPLAAAFLGVSVLALARSAAAGRRFGPLVLGTGAAIAVLAGKFGFDSDAVTYAGLGILVGASVWNAWPRGNRSNAAAISCPHCAEASVSSPS
ncbi:MAG: MerC family mercury resistance protein [Alphaproteobacteria bacterium]|nr:MerC family mercury resistance protein [Alphaproteobacteria bacterium]